MQPWKTGQTEIAALLDRSRVNALIVYAVDMDLMFFVAVVLPITALVITTIGVVFTFLAWRHPRPAPPSATDRRKDEEETAEGIALLLGSLWVARNRSKAKAQESASSN
jgi:flagellar biosynthesis component FlhA